MTAFAGKTLQFGVVPTETKKSMTGLDLLTGIKNGTLPAPPSQQVLDFRISRLKRGVHAEGKVIHLGKRIATAEGRLLDSAGKLYAHGTTTCLIFAL